MGKSTTEQKELAKTREILDKTSRVDIYEFLYADDRIHQLLASAFDMALHSDDDRIRADLTKDLMDRYFGRPTQRVDNTSSDGSVAQIFIGNLKEDK